MFSARIQFQVYNRLHQNMSSLFCSSFLFSYQSAISIILFNFFHLGKIAPSSLTDSTFSQKNLTVYNLLNFIPPYLIFIRTQYIMSHILYKNLNPTYITQRKQITYRSQVGLCVVDAFKKRNYTRGEEGSDIYWVQKEALDNFYMNHRVSKHQRINHYRSYNEICKKDNLNRNLKKYKRQLEREGRGNDASEYNFIPITYHLPIQYALFLDDFKRNKQSNIWIMKPTSKCQGKGIFLFNRINSIQEWAENPDAQNYICQKYIENPLLIGHKKFDLRLYVLCTSYRPLNIYLYREGFARFTHHRYQIQNINNSQMHLTNVAIQKQTAQYNKVLGGKMPLSNLKLLLLSKYPSASHQKVNTCFSQISYLIVKTLKSVSKIMSNQTNCFELYGFDVMLDSNLTPWLIEVNGSPSMRANTKTDKQLKVGVIDDLMTVLDLEGVRTGNEDIIGGFDLICKNDGRYCNEYYSGVPNMAMLGCKLDRLKNYREMALNLNNHYKTNKQNKPIENLSKPLKRPPIEFEQSISPVKKGFSVRKQKRPNSFVKSQFEQKLQSSSLNPQNSLGQSINSQYSQFNLQKNVRKIDSRNYKRSKLSMKDGPKISNQISYPGPGVNTSSQEITFLPQTGKVIPKNSDKSKIFMRKISINKNL